MDTQNPVPDQAPTHDIVLKPCPFCGKPKPICGPYRIHCTKCHVLVGNFATKAEAERAWNRRAAEPAVEAPANDIREMIETFAKADPDFRFKLALAQADDAAKRRGSAKLLSGAQEALEFADADLSGATIYNLRQMVADEADRNAALEKQVADLEARLAKTRDLAFAVNTAHGATLHRIINIRKLPWWVRLFEGRKWLDDTVECAVDDLNTLSKPDKPFDLYNISDAAWREMVGASKP